MHTGENYSTSIDANSITNGDRTSFYNNNSNSFSSNIDFVYTDTDQHMNEIAELYSYNEEVDFAQNRASFEELMEDYGFPLKWIHMSDDQKHRAIERIAEGIEVTDRVNRMRAIRAILYLCQGNFGDCLVIEEQPRFARKNIFQIYDYGMFDVFVQLIHFEIENAIKMDNTKASTSSNDPNVSLKLLITIVYLFVEEMSIRSDADTEYHDKIRQQFKDELNQPICDELLHITLFEMIIKLCNGTGPKFPTKKILLLLWKLLLLTLGDSDRLLELKNMYRKNANLKPVPDDILQVTRRMTPASPPPTAVEIIDSQHQRKMNRPFKRQTVVKQSSFGEDSYQNSSYNDDSINNEDEMLNDDAFESSAEAARNEEQRSNGNYSNNTSGKDNDGRQQPSTPRPGSPRPSSPVPEGNNGRRTELENLRTTLLINSKSLPWVPKVRLKDIDMFFAQVRQKFVGFVLPEDRTTTAGLPNPILESIQVLKRHLYESLAELQIKREEEIARYPLTMKEFDEQALTSFAEYLYQSMLPNLPQYLISLLKLLLGSVSNLKSKNESLNVLSDVMPTEAPTTMLQSLKLKIDLNRHQEIIIKSISAIMLLLLKHYKINHVYQFEYLCQQLMFANCIPLVIKFITQEMTDFVGSKNTIPVLDFPACVIGEQPELTADSIELLTETQPYCWRNMFSSINLLRILNKLTKWKNCRIFMLVLFKSAQPLKRALRVRHAMFQVYVLKLLKMQAKFLGRQWRKSNMKTMSAIYQKVRHRLNDDWAFANDVDTKSLYIQTEEFVLQANINRFHNRRYKKPYPNNINSVTAQALSSSSGVNAVSSSGGINKMAAEYSMCGGTSGGSSLQSPSSVSSNSNVFFDSNLMSSGGQVPAQASAMASSGISPSLLAVAENDMLQPIDNNILSVLSRNVELTKEFKQNYEQWLDREVFRCPINWDELLSTSKTIDPNMVARGSCALSSADIQSSSSPSDSTANQIHHPNTSLII